MLGLGYLPKSNSDNFIDKLKKLYIPPKTPDFSADKTKLEPYLTQCTFCVTEYRGKRKARKSQTKVRNLIAFLVRTMQRITEL